MKKIKQWLGLKNLKLTLQDWALLPFPILLFFSYQPLISLGSGLYKTHYELSLIEIYLAIFVLLNLRFIWQKRREIAAHSASIWLVAFGAYNTVTLAWTPNLPRGILTALVVWLLIFSFFALLANSRLKQMTEPLARLLIVSALLVSVFAWYQLIAGTTPLLSPHALLCQGCQATQFGFARPNAFAVEPQFLGSLLLAPILLMSHWLIQAKRSPNHHVVLAALIFTMTLTLSRGALLALLAGFIVLFFLNRHLYRRFFTPLSISLVALVSGLVAQGLAAHVNPVVSTTFSQAIASSVHQLSLGIVDVRPTDTQPVQTEPPQAATKTQAVSFDGYVERSTDERVTGSCMALGIWAQSPARAMFGTGLGGTGYYFEHNPTRSSAPWCKITT